MHGLRGARRAGLLPSVPVLAGMMTDPEHGPLLRLLARLPGLAELPLPAPRKPGRKKLLRT